MSWAACRQTTRIEDIAYSLMGIFNVFMPMLYGEGRRAFIRLQEEIIKQTEDSTIFAWEANDTGDPHINRRGIFAHSPSEFSAWKLVHIFPLDIFAIDPRRQPDTHSPPLLTSRGLVINYPVLSCTSGSCHTYLVWVASFFPKSDVNWEEPTILCIRLLKLCKSPPVFARCSSNKWETRTVADLSHFIPQTLSVVPSSVFELFPNWDMPVIPKGGEIVLFPQNNTGTRLALSRIMVAKWARWDAEDRTITWNNALISAASRSALAAIHFETERNFIIIVLGLQWHQQNLPWCLILSCRNSGDYDDTSTSMKDFNYLLNTPMKYTDRDKMMVSESESVTAAIRVAASSNPETARYVLHVELIETTPTK
jgi:hypothetical protein